MSVQLVAYQHPVSLVRRSARVFNGTPAADRSLNMFLDRRQAMQRRKRLIKAFVVVVANVASVSLGLLIGAL